ncbi:uncharacterized protein TNCV_34792 [Trichonephila clavipes]|nr:uncharacterized protein TNCV_34792 [Trichonephila clavipes]
MSKKDCNTVLTEGWDQKKKETEIPTKGSKPRTPLKNTKSHGTSKKAPRKKKQKLKKECSSTENKTETASKEPTKPEMLKKPTEEIGDNEQVLREVLTSGETENKTATALTTVADSSEDVSKQVADNEQAFDEVFISAQTETETESPVSTRPEMFGELQNLDIDNEQVFDEVFISAQTETESPVSKRPEMFGEPQKLDIDKKQVLQEVCISPQTETEIISPEPTKSNVLEEPSKKAKEVLEEVGVSLSAQTESETVPTKPETLEKPSKKDVDDLSKKETEIRKKENTQGRAAKKRKTDDESENLPRKKQPQAETEIEKALPMPTKPEILEPSKKVGDNVQVFKARVAAETESVTASLVRRKPDNVEPSQQMGDNVQVFEDVSISAETESQTASPVPRQPENLAEPSGKVGDIQSIQVSKERKQKQDAVKARTVHGGFVFKNLLKPGLFVYDNSDEEPDIEPESCSGITAEYLRKLLDRELNRLDPDVLDRFKKEKEYCLNSYIKVLPQDDVISSKSWLKSSERWNMKTHLRKYRKTANVQCVTKKKKSSKTPLVSTSLQSSTVSTPQASTSSNPKAFNFACEGATSSKPKASTSASEEERIRRQFHYMYDILHFLQDFYSEVIETSTSERPQASTSKRPQASTSNRPQASTSKSPQASTSKRPQASTSTSTVRGTGIAGMSDQRQVLPDFDSLLNPAGLYKALRKLPEGSIPETFRWLDL